MTTPPTNTLGKASLVLSILGLIFVFCIGLCAGVGKQQGWLPVFGWILVILGGTAAFTGFLGAVLGLLGLLSRPRGSALVGLLLGAGAVLLFIAIINAAQRL